MQRIDFHRHNIPSRNQLIDDGWIEVGIGCAPPREINSRMLWNSSQKITIFTQTYWSNYNQQSLRFNTSTWISCGNIKRVQIVVALSRTTSAKMTIIVGEREYASNKMWELITTYNQWTQCTKHVLDIITVNRNNNQQNTYVFE